MNFNPQYITELSVCEDRSRNSDGNGIGITIVK